MLQLAVDQAWFSLFYSLYQSTSTESIKLHSENSGEKKIFENPQKKRGKVFCIEKNCEKKIVLVIEKNICKLDTEGWEFAKFLRSLEQFNQTVKGPNNFR